MIWCYCKQSFMFVAFRVTKLLNFRRKWYISKIVKATSFILCQQNDCITTYDCFEHHFIHEPQTRTLLETFKYLNFSKNFENF